MKFFVFVIQFILVASSVISWAYSASHSFLHWQQQAEAVNGSYVHMTIKISEAQNTSQAIPSHAGSLTLVGKPGQTFYFCSPLFGTTGLNRLPGDRITWSGCSHFELSHGTAILNYFNLQAVPKTLPGAFRYNYFVSDSPLLASYRSNKQNESNKNGTFDESHGVAGFWGDMGENPKKPEMVSLFPGSTEFPWDDSKRRRPPFLGNMLQGSIIDLVLSDLIGYPFNQLSGTQAESAPYTLVLRLPDQPPLYIAIQQSQLENLLNHFTSISSVIQWLSPLVSGQEAFANELLELQALLSSSEEPLDAQLLMAITEQLQIVLELPAADFDLSFEKHQVFETLAAGIIQFMDPPAIKKLKLSDSSGKQQASDTQQQTDGDFLTSKTDDSIRDDGSDQPESMDTGDASALACHKTPGQRRDACYISTPEDTLKILALLRNQYPQAFIALITHPEDFYNDQLLSRTYVNDHQVQQLPGRLYGDEEVVLVIDATQFDGGRLAELNELYDEPSRIHGELLGPNVRIVTLVSQKMKQKFGQFNEHKPSADFWGRISHVNNRFELAQRALSQSGGSARLLKDKLGLPHYQGEEAKPVIIDFFGVEEWRTLLEGEYGVNKSGEVEFRPGLLASAKGRQVVLRNAPWGEPGFRLRMLDILSSQKIHANGVYYSLHGSSFSVDETADEYAVQFRSLISLQSQEPENPIIINSDNVETWLNDAALNAAGQIVSHDALAEALAMMRSIMVSSSLDMEKWNRLMIRLRALNITESIFILDPQEQPKALLNAFLAADAGDGFSEPMEIDPIPAGRRAVQVLEFQDELSALQHIYSSESSPLEINLTPNQDFSNLLGQVRILSSREHTFDIQEYDFLNALLTGRPVILRNLEQNPHIQMQLESLLLPEPELLVNGWVQRFANARVFVIVPEGSLFDSKLWQRLSRKHLGSGLANSLEDPWSLLDTQKLAEIDRDWQKNLKILQEILGLIKSLGRDSKRRYPDKPVLLDALLLNKLTTALRVAQSADRQSGEWWSEAVRVHILSEYQGHPEVYAWLTEQTEQRFADSASIKQNLQVLKQFAIDHPDLDLDTVARHVWRLFRHTAPSMRKWLYEDERLTPSEDVIEHVAKSIVAIAPEFCQSLLKETEEPENSEVGLCQEAFSDNGVSAPVVLQHLNDERERQLKQLIQHYPAVFIKGEAASGKSYIAEKVARKLNPSQPPLILTASPYHDDGDLFGMQRLEFKSVAVSRELLEHQLFSRPAIDVILELAIGGQLTLNESTREALQTKLDIQEYQRLKQLYGDRHSQWYSGPLQQWLDTKPENDQPVFLIIDEANLLEPGLLNALKVIYSPDQQVYDGGRLAGKLTPLHKMIFTGNPETAEGRQLDPFIRQLSVPIYYTPISDDMLLQGILAPEIQKLTLLTDEHKELVLKLVGELWQQFKVQLPAREYTARDLLDISGLLHLILEHYAPAGEASGISEAEIAGLIWYCFEHSLGGSFPAGIHDRLQALRLWFERHYGNAPTLLSGLRQNFNFFITELSRQQALQFSFSGRSVQQLAGAIWQQLVRVQLLSGTGQAYSGRRATLIEGPAARGKDKLLQSIINHMVDSGSLLAPIYISAANVSWQNLRDKIQTARKEGRIIVVSEINLIPSHYLEGELNDILSGNLNEQSPGFHLFATVNPLNYSGRKPLSPALASRFTHFRIGDYDSAELHSIIRALFPGDYQRLRPLVNWHLHLIGALSDRRQILLPTNRELLSLFRYAVSQTDSVNIEGAFHNQYRFYIDHVEQLNSPNYQVDSIPVPKSSLVGDELKKRLYQRLPALPPVTFRVQSGEFYDPKSRQFVLRAEVFQNEAQLLSTVERLFMESLWQQEGLPLSPPDKKDTLLSAIYHQWQVHFYERNFPAQAAQTAWIYELISNKEEMATLNILENQQYIQWALNLLGSEKFKATPANYRKLRVLLQTEIAEADQEVIESTTGLEPESTAKDDRKKILPTPAMVVFGDRVNAYEMLRLIANLEPKDHVAIFGGRSVSDERHVVFHQQMMSGKLEMHENKLGTLGYDAVLPEKLSETYTQAALEVLGKKAYTIHSGVWYAIPGLKDLPHASLKAISVLWNNQSLNVRVLRDRGTGFYLFSCDFQQSDDEGRMVDVVFALDTQKSELESSDKALVEFLPTSNENHLLKDVFDDSSFKSLARSLRYKSTKKQKIEALQNAIRKTFITDQSKSAPDMDDIARFIAQYTIESFIGSRDVDSLKEIFSQKSSLSFFRAQAFWLSATYLKIPVRLMGGATDFFWCEYSLDGGYTWLITNLGGKQKGAPINVLTPELPGVKRDLYDPGVLSQDLRSHPPAEIIKWFNMVEPHTSKYNSLMEHLESFLKIHLSENGPLSTKKLKSLLTKLHSQGGLTMQKMLMVLSSLKEIDEKNRVDEKRVNTSFFGSIWDFMVTEKRWLKPSEVPSRLSLFENIDDIDQGSHTLMHYFEESLAHPLQKGVDIFFDAEQSRKWQDVTKSSLALAGDFTPHHLLPKFSAMLAGLSLRPSYRDTPPGVINIGRLIDNRPAFRAMGFKPKRRSLIYMPEMSWFGKWQEITDHLKGWKKIWSQETVGQRRHVFNVFKPYLHKHLQYAFLQYLFEEAGGKEGTLKMIFPVDYQAEEEWGTYFEGERHYWSRENQLVTDPRTKPNTPLKAGYWYPESSQQMALLIGYARKESIIPPQAWLKKIYNQQDILFLRGAELNDVLVEFLGSINIPEMARAFLKSNDYLKYKEREKALMQSGRKLHTYGIQKLQFFKSLSRNN